MDPREQAALGRFRPTRSWRRRLAAPIVVAASRFLVERLNSLTVHNREAFDRARDEKRPLLTFSNHVSLFDDPWLVATFSGSDWDRVRWCAVDALNFFGNRVSARFFGAGKGVPIVRGAGLDQPGMHFLRDMLEAGEWVHIFPEGGRTRVPDQIRLPFKTGFGHLVKQTRPLVLPFHHMGMEELLPIGSRWPRVGNALSLRFGEAVDSASGLADETVASITAWAEEQLLALRAVDRGEPAVQAVRASR